MEDRTNLVRINGLTDTGTVKLDADTNEVAEITMHLMKLVSKADVGAMFCMVEIGCGEHTDPIVVDTCVKVVGLMIMSSCVSQWCSSYSLLAEPRSVECVKEILNSVEEELKIMNACCDNVVGLSHKGKKRFINSVTEFLIQTFIKNFPCNATVVSETIKRYARK